MKYKGELFVIISAILFGFNPILANYTFEAGSNPVATTMFNSLIGTVVLFLINDKQRLKINHKKMKMILLVAPFSAITTILLFTSYNYIDSGLSTTLHFSYPLFVCILSYIILHDHISYKQVICMIIFLLGICLLYTPGGKINFIGIILALISGVTYATYITLVNKIKFDEIPSTVYAFYLFLFSTIMMIIYASYTHQIVIMHSITGWSASIFLGIVQGVLCLILFSKGIVLCGGLKASLLSAFEPVTSIIIGVLFLHEIINFQTFIACFLIILSTILLIKGE